MATDVATTVGERFAEAIAAKDAPALLEVLDPQVDFRAMTPAKFFEAGTATELVNDIIFGRWFEPTDIIEAIVGIDGGTVDADRHKLTYRFRVTNADGAFTVEQRAYFELVEDRISWLRIMCSGYRPTD